MNTFQRYIEACEACEDTDADIQAMIDTWEAVVAEVGREAALVQFHQWQATVPSELQYSCDPEGGCSCLVDGELFE